MSASYAWRDKESSSSSSSMMPKCSSFQNIVRSAAGASQLCDVSLPNHSGLVDADVAPSESCVASCVAACSVGGCGSASCQLSSNIRLFTNMAVTRVCCLFRELVGPRNSQPSLLSTALKPSPLAMVFSPTTSQMWSAPMSSSMSDVYGNSLEKRSSANGKPCARNVCANSESL